MPDPAPHGPLQCPASWLTPSCLATRLPLPVRCTGAGAGIAACSQLTLTAIDPVDFVVAPEAPSLPLAGDVLTCAQSTNEITQGQYAYCCVSSTSFGPPKETGGLEACTTNNKPLTCLVSCSALLLLKAPAWPPQMADSDSRHAGSQSLRADGDGLC